MIKVNELVEKLCRCKECAIEELLSDFEGDRREARAILADLVRMGLVMKKPDYERRKLVFKATERLCRELSLNLSYRFANNFYSFEE
jgi:hypothetical protein